ncbi:hypothetical protein TVAG_071690 [Trichomonas vaginalis G3]|uniref:Glycosyltransferase 61 catalytic domain-containing protein n=1 Tax=Trichomonas vaginalis (strain ATCC PRA-98 / G3) TaxID=412133 RepID=A2D872_TRIV3|nr:glycosyltransferase family [Trichomonas vaginalis G3]EAY23505.1 hypothetical protein TVAG_071690 [Trichomonas vaginalis G3]KAI5493927.1 glycosyltransferase family [Trichomonas vaginalis G3]|eukprot:XP_001584491.1 hypothetical protein [Trichomonas vaginalis G3]
MKFFDQIEVDNTAKKKRNWYYTINSSYLDYFITISTGILLILLNILDEIPFYYGAIGKIGPKIQRNITIKTWWYRCPHVHMKKEFYQNDPQVVNYALISEKTYTQRAEVPAKYVTKSMIYITLYNDVFVSSSQISDETLSFKLNNQDNGDHTMMQTSGEIDELVFYRQVFWMYGHNIHDFLCAMMYVPQDLVERGFKVNSPPLHHQNTQRLLVFLGYNVTFVDVSKQKFVHTLWLINNFEYAHGYTAGGLDRLRKLIKTKVDFNLIKPTRFVISDRPKGSGRNFDDINKLYEAISSGTKIDEGCKWEIDDTKFSSPVETIVKFWQSIKVLVAPCGSGIYNSIFMHDKCGMCLMFTTQVDEPNLQLCANLRFFLIGVIHPKTPHSSQGVFPVNVSAMVKYTQRVVDAVNAGHWTTMEDVVVHFPVPEYLNSPPNEFR